MLVLDRYPAYTVLASADPARARDWYSEKLGLTPDKEEGGGFWFRCANDTWFFVTPSAYPGTAKNTVMTFHVDDVVSLMAELRGRGVDFEDYDMPGFKTENGLFEYEGYKAAWFKDSEGNTLEIAQTP